MAEFTGFTQKGLQFLADLHQNNNKLWFDQNKQLFKNDLELPAKLFLEALGAELNKIYNLEISGKIFRIYRDVRFSKDKTPYNTHLRISFTIPNKKTSPALMLSIEHNSKLILGCGIFEFSKENKDIYREFIDDNKMGAELENILQKASNNNWRIDIPKYKKVPNNYDASHPRAELLKAKGITLWQECSLPKEFYSKNAIEYCVKEFENTLSLFHWLNFE